MTFLQPLQLVWYHQVCAVVSDGWQYCWCSRRWTGRTHVVCRVPSRQYLRLRNFLRVLKGLCIHDPQPFSVNVRQRMLLSAMITSAATTITIQTNKKSELMLMRRTTASLRATAGTAIARLSHSNSVCPSIRPSVCPSHGWIRKKRCKLGSSNLHHRLPQRL